MLNFPITNGVCLFVGVNLAHRRTMAIHRASMSVPERQRTVERREGRGFDDNREDGRGDAAIQGYPRDHVAV